MKAKLIPLTIVLFFYSASSLGADGPVSECLERYSNADVGPCLEDAVEAADLRLKHATENLALLLKRLDGRELPKIRVVDKLKSAYDEWEEFRDKECAFTASVTMWGGSGTANAVVECVIDLTDRRMAQIQNLTRQINEAYLSQ